MIDILSPLIKKFLPFAQEKMGFSDPPRLFLRGDDTNAKNPLGKTAFYDPDSRSITIYITNRHPKDVMRSLSHELVHHTQNCRGDLGAHSTEPGYAQKDEHMREMEREAYEVGNMCFRDWEDGIKNTIYYEHLQKGEKKMSTKDWKNKEITQLLSEAWGFKFNSLDEFNEFNGKGELQAEGEEEELEEAEHHEDDEKTMDEASVEENEDVVEEGVFSPNHYCVHHGGVSRNGSVEMAEAIGHNFDEELGKVTHYDMKFEDGTIMEGVPFEDIQVTNASLAEGHGHPVGKRDDDEDDEAAKPDYIDIDGDGDKEESMKDAAEDKKEKKNESVDALREAIKATLLKHLKG